MDGRKRKIKRRKGIGVCILSIHGKYMRMLTRDDDNADENVCWLKLISLFFFFLPLLLFAISALSPSARRMNVKHVEWFHMLSEIDAEPNFCLVGMWTLKVCKMR